MKSFTIAQRLLTLLVLVLALLLTGVFFLLHADHREKAALRSHHDLIVAAGSIRYDMLQMSDAMRGLLIGADPENERRRKLEADANLAAVVGETAAQLAGFPALTRELRAIGEFDAKKLNTVENRFMDMVGQDRAAATAFYTGTYLPLREEQDALVDHFVAAARTAMDTLVADAATERRIALWACAVIFAFAGAGAFWLARSFSRPVQALAAAATVLSEGDLSVELPVRESADEIGQLTRAFGRLVSALGAFSAAANRVAAGDLTVEFKPQSARDVMGNALAAMLAKLSALIGQVQRSGIQVNTSINEIAATAKEQQATANEIAATTTEIGATSKEISATSRELVKTVHEVTTVAEHTATLASSGRAGLSKMEETMQQVMAAGASINAKLAVLNEKAGNINQVVTTITKVADQTNLLSLNAAIEAEKAGEYGRGFAVVATEIRRLADQTAVATYDIEQMVKEMQSAVSAGVMGMDKFSEEVRRGVGEVHQVSAQLGEIIQQVQALTPRFEAVNEGMQAQSTGAQQISDALAQLGEAARQTVDSLRQSTEAIDQLNGASQGLKASVEKFRLG